MRLYQLFAPTGPWIDLDHVQVVSTPHFTRPNVCHFTLRLMFQAEDFTVQHVCKDKPGWTGSNRAEMDAWEAAALPAFTAQHWQPFFDAWSAPNNPAEVYELTSMTAQEIAAALAGVGAVAADEKRSILNSGDMFGGPVAGGTAP